MGFKVWHGLYHLLFSHLLLSSQKRVLLSIFTNEEVGSGGLRPCLLQSLGVAELDFNPGCTMQVSSSSLWGCLLEQRKRRSKVGNDQELSFPLPYNSEDRTNSFSIWVIKFCLCAWWPRVLLLWRLCDYYGDPWCFRLPDLSWAKSTAVCLPPSSGSIASSKALHKGSTHNQFVSAMTSLHTSFCVFPLSQTKSITSPKLLWLFLRYSNLDFPDESLHSLLNL